MDPYSQDDHHSEASRALEKAASTAVDAQARESEVSRLRASVHNETEKLQELFSLLEKRLSPVVVPMDEQAEKTPNISGTLTEQNYRTPHGQEQYEAVLSLRRLGRRIDSLLDRLEV